MIRSLFYWMIASILLRRYSRVDGFVRSFRFGPPNFQKQRPLLVTARFSSSIVPGSNDDLSTTSALANKPPKRKNIVKKRLPSISDISEELATVELTTLNSEIRRHSELYFEKNEPEISDAAYDKLVNRAEGLVGKFRHLADLVPSLNTVGMGKSSKFAAFKHSTPMLSLSKAFTTDELASFMDKVDKALVQNSSAVGVEYVLEPKIDGLSLGVIYEFKKNNKDKSGGKWHLAAAGTRGDGDVGEDVTENVRKYMKNVIPESLSMAQVLLQLPSLSTDPTALQNTKLEVRGEVFISRSGFNLLNQQRAEENGGEGKDPQLATARNAAAGALRKTKDITSGKDGASAQDHLQFFAYSLFRHTPKNNNKKATDDVEVTDLHDRQSDTLNSLHKLGFSVAQPWSLATHRNAVLSTCAAWETLRAEWDFDADGAVLKVNDVAQQKVLGTTSRCPKWAVAFKFAADKVLTTLRSIEVRVGRTGVLTPVACLEPVKVGGVVVESATLHNENEINRLNLKIGDKVWLKRAGDVIPKILGVERPARTETATKSVEREFYRLPTVCPDCGSATERVYGSGARSTKTDVNREGNEREEGEDGQDLSPVSVRCTGGAAVCPAQAIEQISHFASRDAASIDGLGRSRVEDLFQGGLVRSVLDLYELRNRDLTYTTSTPIDNTDDTHNTYIADTDTDTPTSVSLRGRKGWGDRSVNHLLAAVDRARLLEDHRFLFGLGVRHIGAENARLLVEAFGGFPPLWEYLRQEADVLKAAGLQYNMLPRQRSTKSRSKDSTVSDTTSESDPVLYAHQSAARLQSIEGVGPKAVEALLEFATHPRSVAQVQGLLGHVSFTSQVAASAKISHIHEENAFLDEESNDINELEPLARDGQSLPLQGRVAVFTGKLESGSRTEAQSLFQQLGGVVRPSINKSVNLLIQAGDARDSSKHKKAVEMGIEIWSEEEWRAFVKRS